MITFINDLIFCFIMSLLKILNDWKIDLVVDLRIDGFPGYVSLEKILRKKGNQFEKQFLEKDPVYKELLSLWSSCDAGTHVTEPIYSKKQETWMGKNPYWKKYKALNARNDLKLSRYKKNLARRLKSGEGTEKEKSTLENAEIKIWKKATDFDNNSKSKYPVITIDSTFYDVLNGEWGYAIRDVYLNPLELKLKKAGYFIEPYDHSTWYIYKD